VISAVTVIVSLSYWHVSARALPTLTSQNAQSTARAGKRRARRGRRDDELKSDPLTDDMAFST
jgi:hypothetical protein